MFWIARVVFDGWIGMCALVMGMRKARKRNAKRNRSELRVWYAKRTRFPQRLRKISSVDPG